jgi:hypothetical protein
MDRRVVQSSNIAAVGYDDASNTLEVEFSNGATYQYFNVPPHLFEAMMAAPSKGSFLNANVKNLFPFSRVG